MPNLSIYGVLGFLAAKSVRIFIYLFWYWLSVQPDYQCSLTTLQVWETYSHCISPGHSLLLYISTVLYPLFILIGQSRWPPTSWGLLRVSCDRGVYTRLPLSLPACSKGICWIPLLIVQSDFWRLRIWIGTSWFIDWLIQRGRHTLQIPLFWNEKVCISNATQRK